MTTMITCPNCDYDHELTDDLIAHGRFTMACHDKQCQVLFYVELEIIPHCRILRETDSDDPRAIKVDSVIRAKT